MWCDCTIFYWWNFVKSNGDVCRELLLLNKNREKGHSRGEIYFHFFIHISHLLTREWVTHIQKIFQMIKKLIDLCISLKKCALEASKRWYWILANNKFRMLTRKKRKINEELCNEWGAKIVLSLACWSLSLPAHECLLMWPKLVFLVDP